MLAELSSTDNRIVRWDSTSGRAIQTSNISVDDSGNMSGVNVLTAGDYVYTPGLRVSGTGDPGTDARIANHLVVGKTIIFYENASEGGQDLYRSSVSGKLYWDTSDRRLKENIEPINDGLEAIKKMKPVHYTRKETGAEEFGFIAQDVNEIDPSLVWYDKKEDTWGLGKWPGYMALAVDAIQKLTKRVEELEKRLSETTN